MVKVKLFTKLREVTGEKELQLDSTTVKGLFDILKQRYGKQIEMPLRTSKVFVNGKNVMLGKGVHTRLNDGDEVVLLPPLAGG